MIPTTQIVQTIKEEYEIIEKQKIDFLFEETVKDVDIQAKLSLYTNVFNFVGFTSNNKLFDKLYEYSEHKCTSFIDKCYEEINYEPFDQLEAYCKYYQIIKKYILFAVSVFNSLYKKFESKNVFIVKNLIDYQCKRFDEIKEDIYQALDQELKKVRYNLEPSSPLIDITFESFTVYTMGIRTRIEKVNNTYQYVGHSINKVTGGTLHGEILNKMRASLESYLFNIYDTRSNEDIDAYIEYCVRIYKLELVRLLRYYPQLKEFFDKKIRTILFKPKEPLIFQKPKMHLLTLLLNERKDIIETLVGIYSLKKSGAEKINNVILEFIKEKFKRLLNEHEEKAELFEKFKDFYIELQNNIFSYFGQYEEIRGKITHVITELLKPHEKTYIKWLVDKIHELIINSKNSKEFTTSFEQIAIYFKCITDRRQLIDIYENKFRQRHLYRIDDINLKNEELAINCIEKTFDQYFIFENIGSLTYDILLSDSFKTNYRYNYEILGRLLVAGKEHWGISVEAFDNWNFFSELLSVYAPNFEELIKLSSKLNYEYSKSKRDVSFLPSLNTFEVEYNIGEKLLNIVVNGWQLLCLMIIESNDKKIELDKLVSILKFLPKDYITSIIRSLEKGKLLITTGDMLHINQAFTETGCEGRIVLFDVLENTKEVELNKHQTETINMESYAIPPKIVKLIKENDRLNSTSLFNMLNSWSTICEEDFKRHIGVLIEKELIKRDAADPNVLIYES